MLQLYSLDHLDSSVFGGSAADRNPALQRTHSKRVLQGSRQEVEYKPPHLVLIVVEVQMAQKGTHA